MIPVEITVIQLRVQPIEVNCSSVHTQGKGCFIQENLTLGTDWRRKKLSVCKVREGLRCISSMLEKTPFRMPKFISFIFMLKLVVNSLSIQRFNIVVKEIVHNINKFVHACVKILNIHNMNNSLLKSS